MKQILTVKISFRNARSMRLVVCIGKYNRFFFCLFVLKDGYNLRGRRGEMKGAGHGELTECT